MRYTTWMLAVALGLATTTAMAAEAEGRIADPDQGSWARWQGRLSLGTTTPAWAIGVEAPALKLNSASLMGDYYFGRTLTGNTAVGGFRATSGLIIGARGVRSTGQPGLAAGNPFSIGSRLFGQTSMPYAGEAAGDSATVPYLGLGYTGLAVRSRLSFSADLGLVAQGPGNAVRFGRVFNTGQSLDEMIREMRLAPLLQLGVTYSF